MIHVTVTDLETNEVKLDKDVNAVVIGTSSEGDCTGGGIGSPLELAFAYKTAVDAMTELGNENPAFRRSYKLLRAVEPLVEDDDADE